MEKNQRNFDLIAIHNKARGLISAFRKITLANLNLSTPCGGMRRWLAMIPTGLSISIGSEHCFAIIGFVLLYRAVIYDAGEQCVGHRMLLLPPLTIR